MSKRLDFGRLAEKTAVEFLRTKGYNILKQNFRCPFGEIDIIAEDKGTICFVEVKARHTLGLGAPQEALFAAKQARISKSAICYLKNNNLFERPARFDVLALLYAKEVPEISLIKDAFELGSKFTP